MRWIKWYPVDWLHSTCRDELTPAERATFHDYTCLASLREPYGEFTYSSIEALSRQLNTPVDIIIATNEKCQKYNRIIITPHNEGYCVKIQKYFKYQAKTTLPKPLIQADVNKISKKPKKSSTKLGSRLDKIRLDKTRKEKNTIYSSSHDDEENIHCLRNKKRDNLPWKQEPEDFQGFWKAYPRKVSKVDARRLWQKLQPTPELVDEILRALEIHKQSEQWKNRQYIPHPSTWLKQRRWEDEVVRQESEYFGESDKIML
jgi:hypothetical protein